MIVDVFGIEAFLPGSQIDVKPIRDYDQFVDKTMEFKVVKINHEFKNVVVSHKALIEADIEEQKKEIIGQLEKGQVLEGTVKNITSYGDFIDLGGVDGLIHITDLSWSRIIHPSEILELDQKLNVVILDFDDNKSRIQLGLKQLSDHPWDKLGEDVKEGSTVKGKVVVIADYGAFIEIEDGVEGLVHVSEMSWSTHLRSAQDFVNVGDQVEAQILTMDRESLYQENTELEPTTSNLTSANFSFTEVNKSSDKSDNEQQMGSPTNQSASEIDLPPRRQSNEPSVSGGGLNNLIKRMTGFGDKREKEDNIATKSQLVQEEERLTTDREDESKLEIPAFLRGQAN